MGIIYDTMRQNFNEEEEEQASLYGDHNLITFHDFIDLLTLHTDDDSRMVCEYLINEDAFLKLDIYTFELADDNSSETRLEIVSHKYDAYLEYKRPKVNDENEHEYPTKDFLEDFLLENGTKNYDHFYFWKIDDLLSLDCMANIGLNESSFGLCQSAMNGNARIILELNKQNKELMASLNELYANAENNELERVKDELADVKAQNAKLIADIEKNRTTDSFSMGTPTVAHGEHKTNEHLINELAAANNKIAKLRSQLEQSTTDKRSYTTPAINIMDKVITEFWLDYNPNKYQSAPKQEIIVRWITGNFDGVSKALALNIDKVCRHSKARSGGKYKR